jgi:hypothetical protein
MAKKKDSAAAKSEKPKIQPAGFLVLRTPLLPLSELAQWSSDLRAPAAISVVAASRFSLANCQPQ